MAGGEVTSAPLITSVDEYSQVSQAPLNENRLQFSFSWFQVHGTAERKALQTKVESETPGQHPVFRSLGKARDDKRTADLTFNPLIDEANQRRRTQTVNLTDIKSSGGREQLDNVSDDFSDESLEPYIGKSQSIEVENVVKEPSHNPRVKTLVVEKEKSNKIYTDGKYLNSTEDQAPDQGYQTAVNSPSDSMRRSAEQRPDNKDVKHTQLLKLEPAMDQLSVSLPETFLKTVKMDLSQSIKSTTSTKSRVHYDPRIFSSKKKKEDPEKEYFEKMSRFYGEMNEKYPPSNDDTLVMSIMIMIF